ncbi:MAG: pyridoxamine 5'-phosphate oxidase family protein [Methanospirillaceae archaeon]|nr:pyridoxamine 5'-phosphate oxidase family protein [Methanospirillaceae archaeon]
MVSLTDEMIHAIREIKVFPLATASADGTPNVAPMGAVFVAAPDTIWIMDNYMNKTMQNVKENKKAALYVYGAGVKGCFQIKGDVSVVSSGEQYEKAKELVESIKPGLPKRSLVILSITEVFSCMPGSDAGKKIL